MWLVLLNITTTSTWLLGDTTFLQPNGGGYDVLGLYTYSKQQKLCTVDTNFTTIALYPTTQSLQIAIAVEISRDQVCHKFYQLGRTIMTPYMLVIESNKHQRK